MVICFTEPWKDGYRGTDDVKLELEISDDILERMNRTMELIGFKDGEELTMSALLRFLDRLEFV